MGLCTDAILAFQASLHELGYSECNKTYVFRGAKEYSPKQVQDMLGLSGAARVAPPRPGQPAPPPTAYGASRFLMPVSQCEFQLTSILENLAKDPWPVANDKRALRCTGTAIGVAVGLLEVCQVGTYDCGLSSDTCYS